MGEDHSFCGGGADLGFPVVQAKLQGDVRDIVRREALKNQESGLTEGHDSRFIKDCRGDAAPKDHLLLPLFPSVTLAFMLHLENPA